MDKSPQHSLIMKLKAFRAISLAAVLACMILIFCFSAQDATASQGTSDPITLAVCKIVVSDMDSLSETEALTLVESVSFAIRKTAHFSIYFVFGACLFCAAVTLTGLDLRLRALAALLTGALYSVTDEIHQLFSEGRSCEFRDVCIDTCGVLLAVVIGFLITRFCKRLKGLR